MKYAKQALAAGLLSAAASLGFAHAALAQTYAEPGDAGQTLATAAQTSGATLTTITGSIGTFADADLYVLRITNTTTFSATATSSAGIDTSLFLFSADGTPLLANDDASNTNFQAALPAGNALLTTLTAGTYYLGISLSGNEAANSANQQLFTLDQPTTNVRGSAAGLNPATLSTFNGQTFFNETGAYSIALVGAAAAVPEPASTAALALGGSALALWLRRRQANLA